MSKAIHLDTLRKEYRTAGNTHVAVDDVTLDIPAGSFTTIVGPSGCGKTTTLRMLAGLETPTSGAIHFGETDVTDVPPQERNVGMVFQSIALYPHMSVRDNIGYALKIRGVPADERDDRIEEAAAVLQITDQVDKMPSELSGGQQQRVALGAAFVQDPDVLLLDEPMSDLDAKLKAELRVEVQRLHKEMDATMVYVTHDQTEAMTMSDNILLLNDGRLEQFAPPGDLFDRPTSEYVARFIGTPSTNVLDVTANEDGTFTRDGLTVDFGGLPDGADAGDTLHLGVRPQYLDIDTPAPAGARVGVGEAASSPDAPANRFDVTIEVIEQLGTEYVLHAETSDGVPVDVVTTESGLSAGDTVTVAFDVADVYVFAADGRTLAYGGDAA